MRSRLSRPLSAAFMAVRLLPGALTAPPAQAFDPGADFGLGGSVAFTSDSIYHGVSESDGHPALQADLHVDNSGTFIGVWGATRDSHLDPYAHYDVEAYLGHRFDLGSSWSGTLSARAHYFVVGPQEGSADYEELSASVTWLDRWTLSLVAIPNAVHYWYDQRLGRSPAGVAETSGQWLLGVEGLFLRGGAGYYYASRTGSGIASGGGYAYGDAGLAFEHGRWRIEAGYFLAQDKARQLTSYPPAEHRLAATVIWRF